MGTLWLKALLLVAAVLVETSRAQIYDVENRSYKSQGGGYGGGHKDGGYKPHPPKKCYPQTLTKYKTIYKDRKANVFNQIEVLNPRPHVKKITETRHTTIRYPVFITQVIKPLLTQVETRIKPIFFTKTITRYSTVLFTVTGIGQVTVTKVKHEKEYITRCQKKGYHRRNYEVDGPEVRELILPLAVQQPDAPLEISVAPRIPPPVGIPYKGGQGRPLLPYYANVEPRPRTPYSPISPLIRQYRYRPNRRPVMRRYPGSLGNVEDLYQENVYYSADEVSRAGRAYNEDGGVTYEIIEPFGETFTNLVDTFESHPPLQSIPVAILV